MPICRNCKRDTECDYDGLCAPDCPASRILRFYNGNVMTQMWKIRISDSDHSMHRDFGPAMILFHPNGQMSAQWWFKNNSKHREDGPAVVKYNEDGGITEEIYYLDNERIPVTSVEELTIYAVQSK